MANLMIFSLVVIFASWSRAASTNDYGLMMLRVSEDEFNSWVKYIIDNHFVPFIKSEYQFDDIEYHLGRTTALYINTIKILQMDNLKTNSELKADNEVYLVASIDIFSISANFTLVTSDVDRFPNATLILTKPSLALRLKIGTGNEATGIDILECSADFDTISSPNQTVHSTLLGLIELGMRSTFKNLVKNVCPYLEDEASTALKDILELEGTFSIYDAARKKLQIDLRLEYSETTENAAAIVTSVTTMERPDPAITPSSVKFPDSTAKNVELWLDSQLLEILLESVVSERVFGESSYKIPKIGDTVYQVYAKPSSVIYSLDITPDGAIFNTTCNVQLVHIGQGQDPCVTVDVKMVGRAPLILIFNDLRVFIGPDTKRLKIDYTILNVAGNCQLPDGFDLVTAFNTHFVDKLKDQIVDLEVFKTEYAAFKDLAITQHQGAVSLEMRLDLAEKPTPSIRNHTLKHRTSTDKLVVVYDAARQKGIVIERTETGGNGNNGGNGGDTSSASDIRINTKRLTELIGLFIIATVIRYIQ